VILQIDRLLDGDVFGFGLELLTGVIPTPILALLVFGSIGVGYYMVQQSFAIPLVMFIMVGGVTIVEAPLRPDRCDPRPRAHALPNYLARRRERQDTAKTQVAPRDHLSAL